MSNQSKAKKKIKSQKELHSNQDRQDRFQSGLLKKETDKSLQNQSQQSDLNKISKEELMKQFPNKMLNMLSQQLKKLEQSSSNLKLMQINKDVQPPDLNLNQIIVQYHGDIFTQYSQYQQSQDQLLADFIKGNPERNQQFQQFNPLKIPNPFTSKLQRLEELLTQIQ
ncbi:unnamed protein product (macronuclear) [Paramecium tetraurelia]|uniref:Uncharacterized protein n=1 Tax=Paramecium tetraurelia TaxID=5888 RepID=A0BWZ7_PARTE|nr:uncharacterized protein GSPATT00032916001 [Paramecium tetraurelia]CAK63064.1 unnamed protein product [Paramecium tetraurelia]|eukprot:XP_001430462.1 hypothetical protein (macronuclear) [Paramecium tetraurelia strain d4-2]